MSRRTLPLLPTALAVSLLLALPVRAQSLQELYDAARAYDASYLASRALADSSQYRLEQTRALNRPSVSAVGTLTRNETDPPPSATNPDGSRIGATTSALTLSGRQPLFNRSNSTTIDQAERTFEKRADTRRRPDGRRRSPSSLERHRCGPYSKRSRQRSIPMRRS